MYFLRDLYPNFEGVTTRETTIIDEQERASLHTGRMNGAGIWMTLAVMMGAVILLGIYGGKT